MKIFKKKFSSLSPMCISPYALRFALCEFLGGYYV